ncbi:phosphotransferase system cellobiose-specific component IIB [Thermanaerovibrio velox DSM 12556]|uniref:Phosphotransferase system cellobiose-specific component IIB n=1 Tax=Thermanaerovibrio velox DSM 12556 TaxID=926567 RepID=H0UPE3_9BACT|nr:phosphotransferase system cellobiose-specific component IIB [Thermanaerovibrio velox DSM 12556]
MKIVLVCFAGMSTSLLVSKMKKAAERRGIKADIEAVSTADMRDLTEDAQVVLLGPQARYMLDEVRRSVRDGVPVEVIDTKLYGAMDGEGVLDLALSLVGDGISE